MPNALTLSRLLLVPVIIWLFYIQAPWAYWCRCALFIACAATDFLDGYFARRFAQLSRLGQLMDPLADKLLTLPVLVVLIATHRLPLTDMPVVLFFIVREVVVPTLRERHTELTQRPLEVSQKAQWKTVLLMLALTALLLSNGESSLLPIATLGRFLLYISALLAGLSFIEYLRATLVAMRKS